MLGLGIKNNYPMVNNYVPTCSIVIRCCNEGEHIGKLLRSLMQQTFQDFEIILVDSGSTDDTLDIARGYPVRILSINPEIFSFGRSLNLGCREARGEYIVIVSAHVYPVSIEWLAQLLKPFQNPKIGLVYGKQRGEKDVTQYSEHQVFAKWFQETSDEKQKHPFCNNANAAIRKSIWQEISYNERLPGLEDVDWAKRMMEKNYYIFYNGQAEIIHIHDETYPQVLNRYRREAIAMQQIFPDQKFHFFNFLYLWISNVLNDYYHAFHDKVFWKNVGSIFLFRLMQFWGAYRGFAQSGPVTKELSRRFYYPRGFSLQKRGIKEALK